MSQTAEIVGTANEDGLDSSSQTDLPITNNPLVKRARNTSYGALFAQQLGKAPASAQEDATDDETDEDQDEDEEDDGSTGDESGSDSSDDDGQEEDNAPPTKLTAASKRVKEMVDKANVESTARVAAEQRIAELEAERAAWSPAIEEFKGLGYNSHAEMKTAMEAHRQEQELKQYQANLAANLRQQIDEGQIDEHTANIQYQFEMERIERGKQQRELEKLQAEIKALRTTTTADSVLSLPKYAMVKQQGKPLYDMLVKAGQKPEDAAEAILSSLGLQAAAQQQNDAVHNGGKPAKKTSKGAPPVSGGRNPYPNSGVQPGPRRTGKDLLTEARSTSYWDLFQRDKKR